MLPTEQPTTTKMPNLLSKIITSSPNPLPKVKTTKILPPCPKVDISNFSSGMGNQGTKVYIPGITCTIQMPNPPTRVILPPPFMVTTSDMDIISDSEIAVPSLIMDIQEMSSQRAAIPALPTRVILPPITGCIAIHC